MKENDNIKDTLFAYVTDKSKWFYWYHNPARLKKLYDEDHKNNADSEEYKALYKADRSQFTKRVWRFKEKTVVNKKGEAVEIEESLADFFIAVLDEVRLKKANDFAEYALYISDNEDLAYFRNTATKREIVADIDYNKQRDHAVHTLYNYLMGWYIFEHSEQLQEAFITYFNSLDIYTKEARNEPLLKSYGFNNSHAINQDLPDVTLMVLIHEFADVWHIVSLLHDIGYVLEGNLSSASPNIEHDRITNGSKIIHDYFNHFFWKSFEIDFRVAKNIAKTLNVVVPDFKFSVSLASLGDRLCDIGSCENIRKKLSIINKFHEFNPILQEHGLNREAFSIWKAYYEKYDKKQMENILYIVERVYKNMMWVGSDYGKRNLDHGVCSGLIMLQALTFFRELFWGFCYTDWASQEEEQSSPEIEQRYFNKEQKEPSKNSCDLVSQELFERMKQEITRVPKRIRLKNQKDNNEDIFCSSLKPEFWFDKILWATASSAIHSILQKEEYRKQCNKHSANKDLDNLKIGFNDDPLAFLGVLVDALQEWDRYKVTGRGEVAFSGDEPLQSIEVYLYQSKAELKQSCERKKCKSASCVLNTNDLNDDSIYLTYPVSDRGWIHILEKTMNYGLKEGKGERNKIVEIIACSNNEIIL